MAGEVNGYDFTAARCEAVDDKPPGCPTSADAMYQKKRFTRSATNCVELHPCLDAHFTRCFSWVWLSGYREVGFSSVIRASGPCKAGSQAQLPLTAFLGSNARRPLIDECFGLLASGRAGWLGMPIADFPDMYCAVAVCGLVVALPLHLTTTISTKDRSRTGFTPVLEISKALP